MARWLLWSSKLEDDRGTRHPSRPDPEAKALLLFSSADARRRGHGPVGSRSAAYRVTILRHKSTKRVRPVLLVYLCTVPPLCVLAVTGGENDQPIGSILIAFALPVLFITAWLLGRRRLAQMREELTELSPACLACRYALAGVPAAGDGCTVCPECGAAWDFGSMDR